MSKLYVMNKQAHTTVVTSSNYGAFAKIKVIMASKIVTEAMQVMKIMSLTRIYLSISGVYRLSINGSLMAT